MIPAWTPNGWEDYCWWLEHDRKMLKKINRLLAEILRNPHALEGSGKPERLRQNLAGLVSRRINQEHRLVYEAKEEMVIIHQCRVHCG